MKRLEDKIALVTGGSRGIGKGIALRLAEEGALVAVHYGTRRDAAEEVVQAIRDQGGRAIALGARLESIDGVKELIHSLEEKLLRIAGDTRFDILVNNAGIGTSNTFEETTEESFDELLAVNVKAPFFLVQQALPLLRDGGRIVNISSGVTRIASAYYGLQHHKGSDQYIYLASCQAAGPARDYGKCGASGDCGHGCERILAAYAGRTAACCGDVRAWPNRSTVRYCGCRGLSCIR